MLQMSLIFSQCGYVSHYNVLSRHHRVTFFQELVSYYQTNSLGASFPGVDTTLQVPYKEVEMRSRGASNSSLPPPLPPSRSNPPLHSPQPHQEKEHWAEVLFNFSSEYPDEMSIEVRFCVISNLLLPDIFLS